MTLTTGPVPVTAAVPVALAKERFGRTARTSRTAVLAVLLDALSAAAAAGLVHLVLGVWAPAASLLMVVAWPCAVALAGGYVRTGTGTHGVQGRALLRAAVLLAVALCVVLAVAPSAASDGDRRLAAGTLLVATALPVVTAMSRSAVTFASPRRPVSVLVV